jgi:asparagine synthase (glutamine-hydrolysing)
MREMDDFLTTQEEPVMGVSQYVQYRVMKLAHENALKVLLDGEGGNEIFAGYVYHFAYYFWELFFKLKWGTLLNEAVSYQKQFRNWLPLKYSFFRCCLLYCSTYSGGVLTIAGSTMHTFCSAARGNQIQGGNG